MVHKIRILGLAVSALLLPAVALAQAPPPTKTPVAPKVEQLDPDACAHSDTQTTVGKGGEADAQRQDGKGNLSDKLARSGGVICPPEHVDSEIKQPTRHLKLGRYRIPIGPPHLKLLRKSTPFWKILDQGEVFDSKQAEQHWS